MLFVTPTVIVLGAGSSADYGLPLGQGLRLDCVGLLEEIKNSMRRRHWRDALVDFHLAQTQQGQQTYSVLRHIGGIVEDNEVSAFVTKFHHKLSIEPYSSIDDFARDNPTFAPFLAPLIVSRLIGYLYREDAENGGSTLRNLYYENVMGQNGLIRNWIRDFCGQCFSQLNEAPPDHPVTVVSFNYDRIFETIIRAIWVLPERQYPPLDQCFTFLYPYGSLSGLPKNIPSLHHFVETEAPNIRSIFSGSAKGHANAIELSRTATLEAAQVFLLGFHCHPTNVQAIGLHETNAKVHAQNYGDHRGLAALLQDLGVDGLSVKRIDQMVDERFFDRVPRWRRTT
jgi:hypothetical protein